METRLENTGASAIDLVIQSRCNLDLRTPDLAAVVFGSKAGELIEQRLVQPDQEPEGSANFDGPARPDGEWRLVRAGSGLILVNRFLVDEVSRASLGWADKGENSVTMSLRSARRSLPPRGILSLEASYEVEVVRPAASRMEPSGARGQLLTTLDDYYKFDGEHALPKYVSDLDESRLYDKSRQPCFRHFEGVGSRRLDM